MTIEQQLALLRAAGVITEFRRDGSGGWIVQLGSGDDHHDAAFADDVAIEAFIEGVIWALIHERG